MSAPLRFRFVQSASDHAQLPPARSEIAFVGRSNVGKSSLLNALAGRRGLAHVSKSPGRTQLLNLFSLDEHRSAMDLPGYGFAQVGGEVRAGWQGMIEGYLLERENLVRVLVLVDGEVGPTPLDRQMLDWLAHHDIPFTVVASKHDKVKPSRREARRQAVARDTGVPAREIVWVSATKGTGIADLRGRIHRWLDEGIATFREANPDLAGEVPRPRGIGRRRRTREEPFVPVQQNPDGTWPDEDEW